MFLKKRVNVDQTNLYKQAYTYLAADNSFLSIVLYTQNIQCGKDKELWRLFTANFINAEDYWLDFSLRINQG